MGVEVFERMVIEIRRVTGVEKEAPILLVMTSKKLMVALGMTGQRQLDHLTHSC